MLSQRLRTKRRMRRTTIGALAALVLLMTTALTGAAQPNVDGPNEYRDCWLGSPQHYDECVRANHWGANFVFATETSVFVYPDRDDVSLTVGNIPSY